MTIIIAADEIKKTLKGYNPRFSERFHSESAKIADRLYGRVLKTAREKQVILLSGGPASGKTEYISEYLRDVDAIIVDGTLPTFEGAKIKIDAALKVDKQVRVFAVFPTDLFTAFSVFLSRERRFSTSHFYRIHSSFRKTLIHVLTIYPSVTIKVIMSSFIEVREGGAMKFEEEQFNNKSELLEFLEKEQYNERAIRKKVA